MTDKERDVLIARHVLGYSNDFCNCGVERMHSGEWCFTCRGRILLPYSTDIAAAWTVWERIAVLYPHQPWALESGPGAHCRIFEYKFDRYERTIAEADTAPKAIALAALRAVGVEVEP